MAMRLSVVLITRWQFYRNAVGEAAFPGGNVILLSLLT